MVLSWLNKFDRCGGGDNLSVCSTDGGKFYCENLNGPRFYAMVSESPPILPVRYKNFRKNVVALTRLFTDQQRAVQQEFQPQPKAAAPRVGPKPNSPKSKAKPQSKSPKSPDTESDEDGNSQ